MQFLFITGIPAVGKSSLAKEIAREIKYNYVGIDDIRDNLEDDPQFKSWVTFFWDKDEKEYWRSAICKTHWNNLKKQSEILWPVIKKKIDSIIETRIPTIFEGVNLLPHLIQKDFPYSELVMLGNSQEEIFQTLLKESRWGETEELKLLEASWFFNCERNHYQEEAQKYNFQTADTYEAARHALLKMIEK